MSHVLPVMDDKLRMVLDVCLALAGLEAQQHLSGHVLERRLHLESRWQVHRLMEPLISAGLIIASAGATGGYRLGQPASAISLAAILRALGSGPSHAACCPLRFAVCDPQRLCPLHARFAPTVELLNEVLETTTLADLRER